MVSELAKNLWARITGWVSQNADHYLYVPIPQERTDLPHDQKPLIPYNSYFRLWLNQMFLTKSREWFRDWYPAVHSSVRLAFGDLSAVNFSNLAQAPKDALNSGVLLNYKLSELMPYNGGTVELEAALLALQGASFIEAGIGVLKGFSDLMTPPLGQVLGIAEKVASGIETFIGASNGNVHLGLHQAFVAPGVGGNEFRPGYFAVILGTANQVDQSKLSVKENQLLYDDAPFAGYDFMLLRIEARKERDDWRLKNIEEPLNKAREALIKGNKEEANGYKKVAMITAFTSPDFAKGDQLRVAQAIKDELAQIEQQVGLGAMPGERRDLNAIMKALAISREAVMARGKISLEELFAD